jgi:hypothetical protein
MRKPLQRQLRNTGIVIIKITLVEIALEETALDVILDETLLNK